MSGPTLATLGLKVENGEVIQATASLNSMTVAGTKTEAATQRLTRRMALQEIAAREMNASMGRMSPVVAKLAGAFTALSAIAAVGFLGREFLTNTIEAQNAMAQLEAAVKSTGGVAGRSVAQLDAFSMAMQQTTTFSDEAVKGAQKVLLTFDKIRGVNFDQATQAIADLATRMGGDLQGAAVQVGKALQDPTTGLTALRRSGVSFSQSQIALIKNLYDTGRVAEGQTVILKELEHQFGGSAAAARDTLGGALKGLKNDFGDLFEVTKGESSALVSFINTTGAAIRKVGEYREILKSTGDALLLVGAGIGTITLLLKASALGFAPFAAAALPVLALAFAFGVLVLAIQNAHDEMKQQQVDADEATKHGAAYLAYLKALGVAHSQKGGAGQLVKPTETKELSDAQKKYQQLTDEISQQTAKQVALNAAFGQSALTLAVLGIRQDEAIKNKKIDVALSAAQHAAVVALNHEYANQLVIAAQLADAEKERIRLGQLRMANLDVEISNAIDANTVSRAAQALSPVTAQFGAMRTEVRSIGDLASHTFAIMTTGALSTTTKAKETEQALAGVAAQYERIRAAQAGREAVAAQEKAEADAQKKYVDDIQAIWREGAGRIAADFVKSMSRGFEEVYSLAVKLMKRMEDANKASGLGYTALKYGAAAIGGGLAGYSAGSAIGAAGGNAAQGALGGAASGAMAGAAFGPWGALVGGIAGAAAGLFGFGKAAKEAAKMMAEAQAQVALSMAQLKAQVTGDTLGAGIAAINADRETRRKAIEDAYQGGGSGSDTVRNRNAQLAIMNGLEDQLIVKLKADTALRLQQLNEDVQVQILRNNGFTAQADALATLEDQERRFAALRLQGIDEATIAALKLSEAARDAAAAAAIALQNQRDTEDLNVRILRATGHGAAADTAAFQNDQLREYQKAVADGKDATYLALLTQTQVLEAMDRAQQLANDAQITAIQDAATKTAAAYDVQIKTAQDALAVQQQQLQAQQQAVEATQKVIDTLSEFSRSLLLNTSLTTLSPIQQLAESRKQFEALVGKAQHGDLSAAGGLPGAASAFLSASRAVNASGGGYVADFLRTQQGLNGVVGGLNSDLTYQRQSLVFLSQQSDALTRQIAAIQAAKDQAAQDAAVLVEAIQQGTAVSADGATQIINVLTSRMDRLEAAIQNGADAQAIRSSR